MGMDFLTSDATFEEKVIFALSSLNTQMESLVGNGQPGKIAKIETRLASLETVTAKTSGAGGLLRWLLPVLLSAIAVAIAYVKGR